MAYEILETKMLMQGKIMDFYQDTLQMPDGKPAKREYFYKHDASAIVPITPEGRVLLVRQYRHPLRDFVLEIPAGVIETGEDPLVCATRELEEETGFRCQNLKFISKFYTSVGISTEAIYLYLAESLEPGIQHLDPDEFLTVEPYPIEEAVQMVFDGRITDGKTIAGLLAYQCLHKK